ncbi:hypothetical protein [Lysobacter xanthus]
MAEPVPTPAPDLVRPTALAAFLRGIERRAAVLAELQTGDPTLGDAALTRAMATFRATAVDAPMADWPRRFWSALLEQPALRRARTPRPDSPLPPSTPAMRAALLLRVAAGLDEATAAAVLDVAPGSLARAVHRGLPQDATGAPDAAAWSRLQAEVQRRVRDLPAERSLRLARMREAALADTAERFFPAPREDGRWRRYAAAVAALGLLALAATWWPSLGDDGPIEVSALGRAGAPASRYSREGGLVAHPDFVLLADAEGARLARDAAFLSWTLGRAAVPPERDVQPAGPDVPETAGSADAP